MQNGISKIILFYSLVSFLVFLKVNKLVKIVIDEEFHIRQAKHYCIGNFSAWDPKITTFPGLYIITSLLLPYKFCNTFNFRAVNLAASILNLLLINKIRNSSNGTNGGSLESLTIALLPPLYFFSHLYYTDVISLTTVLTVYFFWSQGRHGQATIAAIASVLMRQTNIVWIGMMFAVSTLQLITEIEKKKHEEFSGSLKDLIVTALRLLQNPKDLMARIKVSAETLWGYLAVMISFVAFVIFNGSIVVGDKTAHTASLHIPQIFYFSLFTVFFGAPIAIRYFFDVLEHCRRNWIIYVILFILSVLAVKYNTIVHPYLLADNRHYTFYIWNRFYTRISTFRYLVIPIYLYGIALINVCLQSKSIHFRLMYHVAVFIVLAFQQLIDIRYFIIPYIIFRLNLPDLQRKYQIVELVYYILINAVTLYVFFTKEIRWSNYTEIQRLIW